MRKLMMLPILGLVLILAGCGGSDVTITLSGLGTELFSGMVQDAEKNVTVAMEGKNTVIKMKKPYYKKFIGEMKTNMDEVAAALVKESSTIKSVSFSKNYSECNISADYEAYSNSLEGISVFGLYAGYAVFIQCMADHERPEKIVLNIIDQKSKKVMETY